MTVDTCISDVCRHRRRWEGDALRRHRRRRWKCGVRRLWLLTGLLSMTSNIFFVTDVPATKVVFVTDKFKYKICELDHEATNRVRLTTQLSSGLIHK
jgi:hypothetical protein